MSSRLLRRSRVSTALGQGDTVGRVLEPGFRNTRLCEEMSRVEGIGQQHRIDSTQQIIGCEGQIAAAGCGGKGACVVPHIRGDLIEAVSVVDGCKPNSMRDGGRGRCSQGIEEGGSRSFEVRQVGHLQ